MYSTIVVGTDGSPTAHEAVRHATALAKAFGARLHVVTGYGSALASPALAALNPESAAAGVEAIRSAEDAVAAQVREMLDEVAAGVEREQVAVSTHAVGMAAAEAVMDVAEGQNADLIVVGSRGMTGAARFFLGSVANKISHHAPCSVLVVHTT